MLGDGHDILTRKFFSKNSPPFVNHSSFVTQCSIILVHAGSCSSIQGSVRFMQVHLGSTQVHTGPIKGGRQFHAFNYTLEGERGYSPSSYGVRPF